jgi:surface polysaccharide O-acyltransferase-like enzyme
MRVALPTAFTRDDTLALKGLAVLLMIMHHVLISDYYDDPSALLKSNILFNRLMVLGKLCVGLFMFVTAYGYSLKNNRSWHYSFSHIKQLLYRYWALLIFFVILGIIAGNQPQSKMVLLNMFGLSSTYSCANWYVYFYIYAMLILPAVVRLIDSCHVKALALSILLCGIAAMLLKTDNQWLNMVRNCIFYTPVLTTGCYLARCRLPFIRHQFNKVELLLMLVILLVAGCFSRDIGGFCTFTVTVPALAFVLSMLFHYNSTQTIKTCLVFLGSLSLYMWFVHTVFFSIMTRSLFQQSSLWPNSIMLIFLLVFFCSLAVSFLLSRAERVIFRIRK